MSTKPGTFQKGKSGNPSGRPKALVDVVALARSKTRENIERIAHLAANAEEQSVQLRACQILHEIAWGKPVQPIAGHDGGAMAIVVRWANPGEIPNT